MDRCDATGLSGWAFAPRDPGRRLIVRVDFEQNAFQFVRADRYRADVQKAGLGHDGYCGFHIPGRRLAGRVPVRVGIEGERRALPQARRPAVAHGGDGPDRVGDMIVQLDLPRDRGTLAGSVMATTDPDARRVLRLETDDGTFATTRACLYRPHSDAAFRDGHHGFAVAVPDGARSFRLIDEAHGTVLYHSDRHAHRPRR